MSNEFKERPCENIECGEIYRPAYDNQRACSRGCENKLKGIPVVTLRSINSNTGLILHSHSGVVSNRAATRTRQRTYLR